jgi:UDP:flavonoid glycosyltransferase YjiC (YdhE family)
MRQPSKLFTILLQLKALTIYISAGVTQIILPQWCDLYDFATRVESLGHGIHANKSTPAAINAPELSNALVATLTDREGEQGWRMRTKARKIGEACRDAGGVAKVAEVVVRVAQGGSAFN